MNIRKYNQKDYSRVLEIYANSKLDELRFENEPFKFLPLEQDSKRLNQFKESDVYVYEDGEILGYGAVKESEITALFVDSNARARGLGKLILEYLLSKVSSQAILYIAKSNTPAKKLYELYGFRIAEEFEAEYNGKSVAANKMIRNNPSI